MVLCGAAGPPGGARSPLPARLLSCFHAFYLPSPTQHQLVKIFGTMLGQHLQDFDEETKSVGKELPIGSYSPRGTSWPRLRYVSGGTEELVVVTQSGAVLRDCNTRPASLDITHMRFMSIYRWILKMSPPMKKQVNNVIFEVHTFFIFSKTDVDSLFRI